MENQFYQLFYLNKSKLLKKNDLVIFFKSLKNYIMHDTTQLCPSRMMREHGLYAAGGVHCTEDGDDSDLTNASGVPFNIYTMFLICCGVDVMI